MYPLWFLILAVLGSIIQISIWHTAIIFTVLLWLLFTCVGLQGLFGFTGHFFMANKVAKGIGWPAGNPFQTEIAFTNLAFGVLGILCAWLHGNFWLAVIIGKSIFAWGAVYTHLRDMIKNKNFKVYNAGPIFWLGFLVPLTMIILLFLLSFQQ